MNIAISLIAAIPAILLATTIHEFTRGYVSTLLGDTLPKEKGRLTLNPINHFEPVGFLLLLFTSGFGWGKPVETSSLYYKNRKKGVLCTAIIPSVVNIVVGMICAYLYKISVLSNMNQWVINIAYYCFYINIALAVYNIVPVSPMDGLKVMSQVLPANQYYKYLQSEKLFQMLFLLLVFLGVLDFIFTPIINVVILLVDLFVFI